MQEGIKKNKKVKIKVHLNEYLICEIIKAFSYGL